MVTRALVAAALLAVCGGAAAEDDIKRFLEGSRAVMDRPSDVLGPETVEALQAPPAVTPEQKAYFEALRDQAAAVQPPPGIVPGHAAAGDAARPAAPGARPARQMVHLFVSQSMGEEVLQRIVDDLRGRRDVVVTLRGLVKGQTLGAFQRFIGRLIGPVTDPDGSEVPVISIDPPLYREFGIVAVPAMVLVDEKGAAIASVRGLVNPRWLVEAVAEGRRGDLGSYGTTGPISERDMMEQLEEELAKIDVSEDVKTAPDRLVRDHHFYDVPDARVERVREIDPTFEVSRTITAPDGSVIAFQGQRVNPLDYMPFSQHVIVFDARRPKHFPLVRQAIREAGSRQVTLVSSGFDRDGGLAGIYDVGESLGRPVHVLLRDLKERFAIERVPSVVFAQGNMLHVREIPVPLGEGDEDR